MLLWEVRLNPCPDDGCRCGTLIISIEWPPEKIFKDPLDVVVVASLYRAAANWNLCQAKASDMRLNRILGIAHPTLSKALKDVEQSLPADDKSKSQIARERFLVDDTYYHVTIEARHHMIRTRLQQFKVDAVLRNEIRNIQDRVSGTIKDRKTRISERIQELLEAPSEEVEELNLEIQLREDQAKEQAAYNKKDI
jgi:gas vesicle protein